MNQSLSIDQTMTDWDDDLTFLGCKISRFYIYIFIIILYISFYLNLS